MDSLTLSPAGSEADHLRGFAEPGEYPHLRCPGLTGFGQNRQASSVGMAVAANGMNSGNAIERPNLWPTRSSAKGRGNEHQQAQQRAGPKDERA